MKILLTGGAGYKGTVLTDLLLKAGHKVTIIDNLRWGAHPMMHLIAHHNLEFVKDDVRNWNVLRGLAGKADAVINLAAIVGFPDCARHPKDAKAVNVETLNVLTGCMSKDQKLIQASTGSVYGKLEDTCTEESPLNPQSLYGETKRDAEKFVQDFGGVNLRFATAYGVSPCMRFDVLPHFLIWYILKNGFVVIYESYARRTFIDVSDMARSYSATLSAYDSMKGEIFNVGDESLNVTKQAILDIILALFPKEIPVFDETTQKDGDARDYEVNYQKIRDRIHFKCGIPLEESLAQVKQAADVVMDSEPNPWRIN